MLGGYVMSTRIYLHEYIRITGHQRADYFEHMSRGPLRSGRKRRSKMFGIWGTLGSTGEWPEVVNLWESESWEDMAESFDNQTVGRGLQDPELETWWKAAEPMRSGGFDRLLIPAAYSPSIDETVGRGIVGYRAFRHEVIETVPGEARRYLELLEVEWLPTAQGLGMEMIGAYRTALRDDSEVILIWAIRDWETWATVEQAIDSGKESIAWRARSRAIAPRKWAHLMSSAPQSVLQTGVQPQRA
jgi:hypothetical protein